MTTPATASHRHTGQTPRRTIAASLNRLRWMFVALLVLGGIVNYLDRSTLSVGNTTIAGDLGLSNTQMGLLLSAFSWPYAIANLPAGFLVDKFGPKKMYAAAAGAWSAVTMLTAVASSFGPLYAARVALGIAESPFFTSGLKVAERWYAKDERSIPLAVVNTGSQIANAIAPPLLTFLIIAFGWRGMFVVLGVTGVVVVALWWLAYRNPTPEEEASIKQNSVLSAAEQEATDAAGVTQESTMRTWAALLGKPNTWFMVIGAFGIFYTVWVYLTWLPGYLEKSRGFSLKEVGWVAALPYLCGIAGVLAGGFASRALVVRGLPVLRARKLPIVVGAVLAAAAVLPVAYVQSTVLSIVLLCVGYFFAQVPIGVIWTLASDIAPDHQVSSLGAIQNFGGFLGAACAPVVTGIILDRTGGNYHYVFVIGGVMLLVGAVSYGLFVRDRSRA
ncbi:permease of the major facilitator superfamily [Mycolicibacterium canariasense]|uniref:Permease of the major facilitator superfamily n=1 Tax=Mycolicibacterium canariasense TaxID=228230 RepID=A0A100WFG2_MYCCR|nr:MFS transporter [Mycolicibacterium canariasense]MCV7211351.1 MFS transporter [Mycolicibacterium canariasense]ORV03801.1 MFS transporter [Mycolicibacterium canariasense]GAS97296.1 permease of the major facilitator superfamily [Mycolicibacterium canariasense]